MSISHVVRKLMHSNGTTDSLKNVNKYFKLIALGVGAMVILVLVLLIIAILAIFQLLVSPAVSQAPALVEQGQALVEEQSQQNWWSVLFSEQYEQVQGAMQQIDDAQQVIQDPSVLLQQQLEEAQNTQESEQ